MPDLYKVFRRLKATCREHDAVAGAVRQMHDALREARLAAPPGTSPRDFEAARLQLEPTYLVRLWAEFETALRSYRRHVVGNPDDNIKAFHLIEWAQGIEKGRKVEDAMRGLVHEVREYRTMTWPRPSVSTRPGAA